MRRGAASFSDAELVTEVATRLGLRATGPGGAAPRGQQELAAAVELRRRRLVDGLRDELAAVALEAWHPVEATEPAAGPAPADGPAGSGAVPEEWLEIARGAGRQARLKLAGELLTLGVVERPHRYPAKRFFVLVAASEPVRLELARLRRPVRGVVHGSFAEVEGYVALGPQRGRVADEAIFCGFHNQAEAEAYWSEACPGEPLVRLPCRRFR